MKVSSSLVVVGEAKELPWLACFLESFDPDDRPEIRVCARRDIGNVLDQQRQWSLVFDLEKLPSLSESVDLLSKFPHLVLFAAKTKTPTTALPLLQILPITVPDATEVLLKRDALLQQEFRCERSWGRPTTVSHNLLLASRPTAPSCGIALVNSVVSLFVKNEKDVNHFGLIVQELLQNALEHGSFALTGAEKRQLCEKDELESFLNAKSAQAEEGNKTIRLQLNLTRSHFRCTVTDDGQGFAWRERRMQVSDTSYFAAQGRGLMLVGQLCDHIEFNELGNSVTVEKKFR